MSLVYWRVRPPWVPPPTEEEERFMQKCQNIASIVVCIGAIILFSYAAYTHDERNERYERSQLALKCQESQK